MAWNEFSKGKTKKLDVQTFTFALEDHIFQLHFDLKNKTYAHQPYHAFFVRDPKLRHIHKATVRDRVVHHALFRILYPLWDRQFIFDSYSCRIGKGTHKGVLRLHHFMNKETKNNTCVAYVLKCDIRKFFDSIDHDILKALIAQRIKDPDTRWLIYCILESFHTEEEKSIPLGNVSSQLFANIYLHELDLFIKHTLKIKHYLRYCDDFVMVHHNPDYLRTLIPHIENFLHDRLRLFLHPDKIILRKTPQGVDFLGYVVLSHHIALRTKTKQRIYKKMEYKRKLFTERIISEEQFYQSLQSYMGILKHCRGYTIEQKIMKIKNYNVIASPSFGITADAPSEVSFS